MTEVSTNQIVRGAVCGVFVVLGQHLASDGQTRMARLKEVDPRDLGRHLPGELSLPLDRLLPYHH